MLELYTYGTANGQRVSIMLEECGLPYRAQKVDLARGEQKRPEFLALSPAGQIPVLIDPDGPGGRLVLPQSTAILLHLAEKTGRFLPNTAATRPLALVWLMAVMTDVAPASGALFHASTAVPEAVPAVVTAFEQRLLRFLANLDHRLGEEEFLAGEISIADFALYPTMAVRRPLLERTGGLDHLRRWTAAMAERQGVARGMAVPG
jgi:GST-like protein